MYKLFLFSAVLSVVFYSCKNDPIPVPNPPVAKKVKKISSDATDYYSFEYNAQGQVSKYISQWKNGTGGFNKITHTMEYNGNQLAKVTNDIGHTLYTCQSGRVTKAENFIANGKRLSTILFNYDQQNRLDYLIEQIAFPVEGGAEETKVSCQYYPNGNVSRMDFAYRLHITDPFETSFSKLYVQYDNQPNPEPDGILGNFLPGLELQINNPVKVTNLDKNGVPDGYSRYEYMYDASGYPAIRKHFIALGTVENPPVIYQYQY